MRTAVDECGESITRLFSRLAKSLKKGSGAKGVAVEFVEKLKWPFKKDEFERDMQSLRRLLKVFEFSLNLSSWYVIRPQITIIVLILTVKKRAPLKNVSTA